MAMVESQRAKWAAERLMRPSPILLSSRSWLRSEYDATSSQHRQIRSTNAMVVQTAFIGAEPEFSATPVSELREISLRDMLAPYRHRGRYLLARVYLPPAKSLSINLYVEDRQGDAILVTVYNYPRLFHTGDEELNLYFPKGQIVLIREPWAKPDGGLAHHFIRIDSPSDLVLLDASEPILRGKKWQTEIEATRRLPTSAEEFRVQGNALFRRELFVPAAMAWSRGLELDPDSFVLQLNRSQAYLKLRWFGAALADAQAVLSHSNLNPEILQKAAFRAASAEYGLGHYETALSHFLSLESCAERTAYILKCQERLQEARGVYSMSGLFEAGQTTQGDIDVADYSSPAIHVGPAPNRRGGRGVFATRDIECGELLVVTKPFASTVYDSPDRNQVIVTNLQTSAVQNSTTLALMHKVTMRLFGCPEENQLISALHSGPSVPEPSIAFPPSGPPPPAPTKPSFRTNVDIHKIEDIVFHNCFTPKRDNPSFIVSVQPAKAQDSLALYAMPSLFNHSCLPNALWVCFGDIMIIRSIERIDRGREITISHSLMSDKKLQDAAIESRLGAKCDCARCASENVTATQNLYSLYQENMQNKLQRMMTGQQPWGSRTEANRYLQKVIRLLPQLNYPNLQLFLAHEDLMQVVEQEAQVRGDASLVIVGIRHGFDALKAAGLSDIDTRATIGARGNVSRNMAHVIPFSKTRVPVEMPVMHLLQIIAHISAAFKTLSQRLLAERWLRGAWWVHETCFGGGQALFDIRMRQALYGMPLPTDVDYSWE
ncbi:hypothetical protein SISNIDRAFT_487669 [Sistotremastrum niveocremeum HHB9708]|uniref:SET domain-containing protein n=1 Tax=Sistotremastrum niveocremeum HHB9708 TaxID=1314777 RepID=A0A164SCP9_9AGAM|nr:hypothetical protein SISNIDRAFT_487669 [Sistotremastrum niveocremeum HHB9708]